MQQIFVATPPVSDRNYGSRRSVEAVSSLIASALDSASTRQGNQ